MAKVLKRGEKIELLVDKTDNLNQVPLPPSLSLARALSLSLSISVFLSAVRPSTGVLRKSPTLIALNISAGYF